MTIDAYSVIGTGSVLTASIPKGVATAGNPAPVIQGDFRTRTRKERAAAIVP